MALSRRALRAFFAKRNIERVSRTSDVALNTYGQLRDDPRKRVKRLKATNRIVPGKARVRRPQ